MWNRHFIVALVGYFFLFMSVTLFFIFPLFFEQFEAPKSRIGLIMGIHSLTAIFIRPVFGRLIDLKGRRGFSLFGIGFMIVTLPFFHLINNAGFLPILLRALTGIGWAVSMTAAITMCSDLAPVNKLAKSMGIIGVAGLVSVALGPLLGEEIVRRFGFEMLFNTSLAFLVFAFVCMLVTKESFRSNNTNGQRGNNPFLKFSIPAIILISSLPVAHGGVRGAVVHFIALFGKSIPFDRIGPFFVAFSVAAILTRIFFADLSDRLGRKQVLLPSVLIISINLVIISQIQTFWVFVLTGFIGGLGQGLVFPALSTYIIDVFGQENKGFALSLYLTFFDVGMGFGSALFGWISDLYGYRLMFLFAGVMFLLVGAVFTWRAPAAKRIMRD